MQDTTKMQLLLIKAHEINKIEEIEKQTEGLNPQISKKEADEIWNKKLKEAQEKSLSRQKSKEELIKETQEKLAKQITKEK